MTTVAVNRYMMAADRQFTHASGMKLTGDTKIHQVPLPEVFDCKKAFIGFCGNADNFGPIITWLYNPLEKQPKCRGIEMLVLTDKGHIMHGTTLNNWMRITEPHFSVGSGMHFAQAAMASGKDPYEAVKIASKFDPNTGMGYTKLIMKEK